VCVCVCVCVWKRECDVYVWMCVREKERMCAWERERERLRVCVCLCVFWFIWDVKVFCIFFYIEWEKGMKLRTEKWINILRNANFHRQSDRPACCKEDRQRCNPLTSLIFAWDIMESSLQIEIIFLILVKKIDLTLSCLFSCH